MKRKRMTRKEKKQTFGTPAAYYASRRHKATWEAAKIKKIELAISEAHRFIQKAAGWKRRLSSDEGAYIFSSKEGGAAKRASMDLSRALADLRKS
jgi:hypothetical protein